MIRRGRMKRIFSGIMLSFLLLSILRTVSNVELAMASDGVQTRRFWFLGIEADFGSRSGQFLISELLKYENWNNATAEYVSYIHLLSCYYYTGELVDPAVRPCLRGLPTKANVESEIKNFLAQAYPGDIVVVSMSCHGDGLGLVEIGVYYYELDRWLCSGSLQNCFVTVILDTCQAGHL